MPGNGFIDMTGWKMKEHGVIDSEVEVISYIPNTSNNSKIIKWNCRCLICNNNFVALGSNLRNGHTKSCGCLRKTSVSKARLHDLTGLKFGLLTVIKRNITKNNKDAYWDCKCECGNEATVLGANLIKGRTASCGCNHISLGEQYIQKILKDNNIHFKYNSSLNDLTNYNNNKLRYDFIILDNQNNPIRFIEFDGPQHEKPVEWFGGIENFQKQKENDNIKTHYALSHNIPLIRIPYKERDNISLEMLMGNKYLIKEE